MPPRSSPSFPGPVPADALRYLREKGLLQSFDYRDVWAEEHVESFTVAKAMEDSVLTTIRQAIDDALAKGIPFDKFRRELTPLLQELGWWGNAELVDPLTGEAMDATLGTPRRLRTIFDANLRTARAVGQWERIERTKALRPFLVYELGPSERHRPEHESWSGLVLPADDPWWNIHFPPNGWGCKCRVRQIARAEAERLGGVSKAPVIELRPWVNARTGETRQVSRGVDPGWDYNPGKVRRRAA